VIVRRLDEVETQGKVAQAEGWTSRRLLMRADGMGFSMHDTLIHAGADLPMHYKNHLEAVYCVEGKGEIFDEATGETHPIRPGTLYALDQHDEHVLRAEETMRMICVFNPPLRGDEVHGEDGAYPVLE